MTIEERLLRRNDEDILEIGKLAQELIAGDRGKLLYALTNGQIWRELKTNEKESTDEKIELLGKLRSYVELLQTIERCVAEREALLTARVDEAKGETSLVEEPNPQKYGSSGII